MLGKQYIYKETHFHWSRVSQWSKIRLQSVNFVIVYLFVGGLTKELIVPDVVILS